MRHLLMHVCTINNVAHGAGWRPACQLLRDRIGVFDGKRVVAVASGGSCGPAQEVRDFFRDCRCEFIDVENSGLLREVASHNLLWECVADADGATFYCHSKGCTRPTKRSPVPRWTQLLFELNLDYLPLVDELLARFPIVGAFKKRCVMLGRTWHYSGAFYWVRNAALAGRDWRAVEQKRYGVESWPALQFQESEAGCQFGDIDIRTNLYSDVGLQRVEREYEEWKQEMATVRVASFMQ